MKVLQQMFAHCIHKFKDFVFMHDLLNKLRILMGKLLPYLHKTQIYLFYIWQGTMAVDKIF